MRVPFLLPMCFVPLVTLTSGHAVMTLPAPREGTQDGYGIKLSPFPDARLIANQGCGGVANRDPGVQTPVQTYAAGATVQVQWKLTIPHPADNELNGIRVALHVSAADSFEDNILAGGVEGDPPGYIKVPAGDGPNDLADSLHTVEVTLPPGKTCPICTLQWVWSAQGDGGSYVGCSDISITTNGQPITPTPTPTAGQILAGVPGQVFQVQPPPPPGLALPPPPFDGRLPGAGAGQELTAESGAGIGAGGGFFLGLIFGAVGMCGGLVGRKKWRQHKGLPATKLDAALGSAFLVQPMSAAAKADPGATMIVLAPTAPQPKGKPEQPPPPPSEPPPPAKTDAKSDAKSDAKTDAKTAPPKWRLETDEASGKQYYYNTATGESSWSKPPDAQI